MIKAEEYSVLLNGSPMRSNVWAGSFFVNATSMIYCYMPQMFPVVK